MATTQEATGVMTQQPVQQVVVVQQPSPNIKFVDQDGNPVAAPIQQQVVVVQNPAVKQAINQQNINLNVMTKEQKDAHIRKQLAMGGGFCWRVTLIVLWSITLAGGVLQLILGAFHVANSSGYYFDPKISLIAAVLLPGLITIICGSISVFGVHKYNYSLTIVSAVTTGIVLFIGVILLFLPKGAFWFMLAYLPPFAMYSCIFSFSIVFAKHISFVNKNGYPDPNACCKCGDGCCGPTRNNQPVVYHQPGIPLQVAVGTPGQAQGEQDGPSTTKSGTQAPAQKVVVVQVQQDNDNENVVRQGMMTNGGYCWKVTLIVLWSVLLAVAMLQFIMGLLQSSWSGWEFMAIHVAFTIPGAIGLVSGSISIYGLSKYNYQISIFSCIATCILMVIGFLLFQYEFGALIFAICYVPAFVLYAFIFSFSIVYTKKLGFVQAHGHAGNAEEDCCNECYQCCNCQQKCDGCC